MDGTLRCDSCGTHFALSPGGQDMTTDGMACPECGGKRLFMEQPSPTQSDGTLRDMVDSDTQIDQGGNPLGEGTIMGVDGERNQFVRDNYMHSNTHESATESVMDRPATFNMEPYPALWHEAADIGPLSPGAPGGPAQMHQYEQNGGQIPGNFTPGELALGVGAMAGGGLLGAGAEALGLGGAAADAGAGATAGEDAIEGEAAKEGGGAASALAQGAGKQLVKGVGEEAAKGIGGLMKGALGMGAGGGLAAASPTPGLMSTGSTKDIPMILVADFETMDSVPSLDEQDDGPHGFDQKEFDSGDRSPSNFHNPNMEDSGAMGEDNTRSDSAQQTGFSSNSPGIERANMVMPLLMHYYNSEESGERDPIIRGLHEALEQENPGYLTQSDPAATQAMVERHRNPSPMGVHAGVNTQQQLPGGAPTTGPLPGQAPVNSIPQPQMATGTCPQCGGVLGPDGSCPQCGNGNNHTMVPPTPLGGGMAMAGIAYHIATHQGPVTPEQIAAVQEVLISQGRDQECPNVPLHPEQYAKEMAEIQQQPNIAPQIDPSQLNQTPPPAQPQAPGAMPVNDPSQAGGGAPMQPMSSQVEAARQYLADMEGVSPKRERQYEHIKAKCLQDGGSEEECKEMAARTVNKQRAEHGETKKADANTMTPRCPKCGSGSTSIDAPGEPSDGESQRGLCHACYTVFDPTKEAAVRTADANTMTPRCPECGSGSTRVHAPGDPTTETDEPQGFCPSCGNIFDASAPKKASLIFAGEVEVANPLLQQHEPHMKWADVQGNDLVEGQTYELHSSAFAVPTEIRLMQVKPDGLEVQLTGGVGNATGQPDFKIPRREAQLEHYEFVPVAAAPHSVEPDTTPGISPEQVPPIETTDETPDVIPHTQASVEADPSCQKCGSTTIDTRMLSPEVTHHECVRCANEWETRDEDPGTTASVDLSWINQDDDDDFGSDRHQAMLQAAGNQSRNLTDIASKDARLQEIKARLDANEKLAGKYFSQSEKRALIDEHGTARNLTDLDLEGTHYDTRVDYSGKANGANVEDDHFALGL